MSTHKFRQDIIQPNGLVYFKYPEGTPAYRRGFTPAGGAKLNFPIIRKMEPSEQRLGIPKAARKPTKGSNRIFQVIGNKVIHHTKQAN